MTNPTQQSGVSGDGQQTAKETLKAPQSLTDFFDTNQPITVNKENYSMDTTQCSNPNHPQGAWHTATPLPGSWQWLARFKQWRNRKRWGCNCNAN